MTGYLSLAESSRGDLPKVGDLVTLSILLDGEVGSADDSWGIKTDGGKDWLGSGSFTLSLKSLKVVPSDGKNTKLHLQALLHQPGPIQSSEFTLVHIPTGTEVLVASAQLGSEASGAIEEESSPPQWMLPPIPLGGWNIYLISFLGLLLLAAMLFAGQKLLKRMPSRKKHDHRYRALQALQGLHKFARAKTTLKQEEWKRFSFELAGIVRKFSDENFHIDSSDMTDREFLAELRLHAKARPHVDSLAQILSTIDEVRYGKKDLNVTVVPGILMEARKFVESTFVPEDDEGKK